MRARVSSKGQLVLPAEIRRSRNLGPASLDELLGSTGYRGPRKTLKEMEAAIAEGARARR